MQKLIVANWKMNPETAEEAKKLFDSVKNGVKKVKNIEVVICPPFIYLPLLKGLALGAQNVFYKESGAFTGEVSPLMLKNLNVQYVILGHSEARKYLNETNELINKKIKEVLAVGLKPIICIGEKEGEDKNKVLQEQLKECLKSIEKKEFEKIIIAYEPVWAIGTGKNCSIEETMNSVLLIKKIIADLYKKEIAEKIRIIYGGSVNGKNSREYILKGGVSGLLVGGASLDVNEFTQIVKSVD